MNSSSKDFELELNGLLKEYFSVDELNCLNPNNNNPEEGSDKITGMINDIYKINPS